MRHSIKLMLAAFLACLAAGCIKNDIPYPYIQVNFTKFTVEGQARESVIDSTNLVVNVYLDETVDPYAVKVTGYSVSDNGEIVDNPFDALVNLSSPLEVTLRLYQDYKWTISATQDIERYFTIENQVGISEIDGEAHTVDAQIPTTSSLSSVKVNSIKLGPSGSTMTPDLSGTTVDFTHPVEVTVTSFGRKEVWTITVTQTEALVTTTGVDAWTRVAWVYGEAREGRDNGVEYRVKGDRQWVRCPADWIVHDGGAFHARIVNLMPMTTYETRTYSGEDYSQVSEFTTGEDVQLPNMTFDDWWLDGKVWNPWTEGGEPYWDTGNKGATTLGQSNSVPTDITSSGTGRAAMLETKFVGIAGIGKLAAGNIFVGKYVRTDGTNGVLTFGREFNYRPTKLTGYYKYQGGLISNSSSEMSYLKGQPDTCIVYIALIDTPEPFEIRTNPKNRQLFDPDGDYVVAYGKMQTAESSDEYARFEIELDYRSTSRVPTYIIITASASKYGDYFTGYNGAVMCVDNLELLYDY